MTPEELLHSYYRQRQIDYAANSTVYKIGTVHLPNGKILCADPFLLEAELVVKKLLPAGKYEAYVHMVSTQASGLRAACAILKISSATPEEWVLAMKFPVNSGLACFVDAGEAGNFATIVNSFPGNYYDDKLAADFRKNAVEGRQDGDWLLHSFSETGDMAICSSGMGDGQYTAYISLDAAQHPVAVLMDFNLYPGK